LERTLIVYDLDGTLVNSAEQVLQILNILRFDLGLEPLVIGQVASTISLGGEDLIRQGLAVPDKDVVTYLDKFRKLYSEFNTTETSVYPEVHSTLETLMAKDVALSICTNKPRNLAEKVLYETNLMRFFEYINAGGDLPSKKPHRDNLIACVRHFNITFDNVYLVGDSSVDQNLAINSDVKFIFYASGYNDGVDLNKVESVICQHSEILSLI